MWEHADPCYWNHENYGYKELQTLISMSSGKWCCYNQVQTVELEKLQMLWERKGGQFSGPRIWPCWTCWWDKELCHLISLATLGVLSDEHSMHITYLQPLQSDQPAHHPLSNQSLSRATSTKPSSATQNTQLVDIGSDRCQGQTETYNLATCRSMRALRAAVWVTVKTLIELVL